MNWKRIKTMLGAALLTAALAAGQQTDRADLMMEAAARKERVDGDLKAAIEQYRKIAAQFAKQPEIAAQALVQMGQCQEKLGQAEARKSYERVVKEYAGAGQYAAQARARLAALSGPLPTAGEMSLRALNSGPQLESPGGMSSDGRLIAFTDYYRGGSPSVYETATKRTRRLVSLDWNDQKNGFGDLAAISREGKWVAFTWYTEGAKQAELRVVAADGSGMRTVVKDRGWMTPLDWAPDGRTVLALFGAGSGPSELCVVGAADGSVRALKKFEQTPWFARISPDGRWIAYQSGGMVARVMAHDGSLDWQLFDDDPKAQLVDWTPDGRSLVFLSERSGARALWQVPMEAGKPAGEPQVLRSGMPEKLTPIGITSEDRMFYVENSGVSDSFLLPLSGGAPTRLTRQFVGNNGFAAYSPDGQRLVWFGLREQWRVGDGTLVVRDLASGVEKTMAAPVDAVRNFAPEWLADNRSIVFRVNESGKEALVKLDVEPVRFVSTYLGHNSSPIWSPSGDSFAFQSFRDISGESRMVVHRGDGKEVVATENNVWGYQTPAWCSDSRLLSWGTPRPATRRLYDAATGGIAGPDLEIAGLRTPYQLAYAPDCTSVYVSSYSFETNRRRIYRIDLETRQETDLYSDDAEWSLAPSVSPDGKWLALVGRLVRGGPVGVLLMPPSGGTPRMLATKSGDDVLSWTPDSKHVFYLDRRGDQPEIFAAPIGGGAPVATGIRGPGLSGLSLHPDGKRALFSRRESSAEVWSLRNFMKH